MNQERILTIVFCVVFCNVAIFIELGQSKVVNVDQPLPPVWEDRTFSRQLEIFVQNGTSLLECSVKDDPEMRVRNGIIDSRRRWTNFNVYIDPAYNSNERTLINNAVFRLSQVVSCIRFGIWAPGQSPSGDYVHVKKGIGCWSFVGKLGRAQDMSLQSPGCMSTGTIMHEMIHALGFYHEQSRPDRDDYVNIWWNNISPGTEHNFRKLGAHEVTSFGVSYNTRSIMHYRTRDFSRNGQATITTKNGGDVGSTGELQQTDIDKLKRMYNC